jgi:hypothetical protein
LAGSRREQAGNQAAARILDVDDGGMLELRPNCECCDTDLPPDAGDAMICTFECTWCRTCVETVLHGVCPNCGGGFTPRPVRPPDALRRHPASTTRVLAEGCGARA